MKKNSKKIVVLNICVLALMLLFSNVAIAKTPTPRVISIDIDGKVINYDISSNKYIDVSDFLTKSQHLTKENIDNALMYPRSLDEIVATHNVVIRTVKNISININGKISNVQTYSNTVGELKNDLQELKSITTPSTYYPAEVEPVVNGVTVKVTSDSEKKIEELKDIAITTTKKNDSTLQVGTEKVVDVGVLGKEKITYSVVLNDGKEKSRKQISSQVITPMKPKVVLVGTKPAPVAATPAPTVAPQQTNGSRTESGKASWYDYIPGSCAHKTIPKGTVVTVTNVATGASTTCIVKDRGPYIAGRIIDLDRSVFSRIASVGAGVISVRISW